MSDDARDAERAHQASDRPASKDSVRRGGTAALLRRRGLLPQPRSLRSRLELAEELPSIGNKIDIYYDGASTFNAMLQAIASATTRISIEMYWFQNDTIGHEFQEALIERVRAGVEIRLLFDSLGCWTVPKRFFSTLRSEGVDAVEYHPIAPWRKRFALFGRNHRKTLVVDERIGFTGGVNIADCWLPRERTGESWRDTHVRVEGPAAADLEILFAESWHKQTGELLSFPHSGRRRPDPELSLDDGDMGRVLVIGGRGFVSRAIRNTYLALFDHARERIEITCPYLVPDLGIRRALTRAAERGVEVSLLLPTRSDVRVVDWASRAHFDEYLRHGIRIQLYQSSFLHAKTVRIDDTVATVGTSNLDRWSLTHNLETNLILDTPVHVHDIGQQFDVDLEHSREITLPEWRERSWLRRILERLASLTAPWL